MTLYEAIIDRQILHNFLTLQHQELDRPLPFSLGQPLFLAQDWGRDRGLGRAMGLCESAKVHIVLIVPSPRHSGEVQMSTGYEQVWLDNS